VSQIATFISYNATNTTSPTQTPITSTGAGSRNGTNILTDYSTLVVATATPPAPSQPAATTTKKSAGSRSAQNPIAQLVKYFKTLVPDSKPKKLTAGGKKTLGWTFWTSTTREYPRLQPSRYLAVARQATNYGSAVTTLASACIV
jgi:hypothetical protein